MIAGRSNLTGMKITGAPARVRVSGPNKGETVSPLWRARAREGIGIVGFLRPVSSVTNKNCWPSSLAPRARVGIWCRW